MSEIKSHVYAVIMAGGSGTRFWPLSREQSPKQVLSITGPNSLLQDTIERLDGLVSTANTFVVTSKQQVEIVAPHLKNIKKSNILIEPTPRNTAPCIGLAAIHIQRIDPEGIMIVLPSDHRIGDVQKFQNTLDTAIKVAQANDALVTIGIPPTRPETGYGYIQFEPAPETNVIGGCLVKTFAEKPNRATAERFIEAGDFNWNSGIFVWKASRILAEMEEHLPDQYEQLQYIKQSYDLDDFQDRLTSHYNRIKPISIDYGIMERSRSPIYMLSGDFMWSDIGSWDELYRILSRGTGGNVTEGEAINVDAHNNLIYSTGKMTAVMGLDNMLVVNTPDATLICPLDRAQDVKLVVDKLRKEGRKEYL